MVVVDVVDVVVVVHFLSKQARLVVSVTKGDRTTNRVAPIVLVFILPS